MYNNVTQAQTFCLFWIWTNYTVISFIFVQIFCDKNFRAKMICINDCSIRVVQSYVKIFVQVLHTKMDLTMKRRKIMVLPIMESIKAARDEISAALYCMFLFSD